MRFTDRRYAMKPATLTSLVLVLASGLAASAETPAERGYRHLTSRAYVPADFEQDVFENVWKVWEQPLKAKAAEASDDERRELAFERYGLTPAPGRDDGVPLQYVNDGQGGWSITCFACHGGKVAGRVIPGLPNSHFALESLIYDIRLAKLRMQRPLVRMDLAISLMPLGRTNGTTNAVVFSVGLLSKRDKDMNVIDGPVPELVHHDLDAPPWWHLKKKKNLYIDGFVPKNHRALMQFLLVPENGPEQLADYEDDFRDILAYIESLEAPGYPFEIDRELASQGRKVFLQNCAECHGTYGDEEAYPERLVPIETVGTDRVRLDALSEEVRTRHADSWLTEYGKVGTIVADPGGYVAPPLDGVWATAPYFHNGSVPTLWHVLHPDRRPQLWRRRTTDGYDTQRVGLDVETFDEFPDGARSYHERRKVFDTSLSGKSSAGHRFPEKLAGDEKRAVLEYLKTL